MHDVVAVLAGGFAGAGARYMVTTFIHNHRHRSPVLGTLAVNLAGCFLLGYLTTSCAHHPTAFLLLGTGFTGAFTTFSTFAGDVITLIRRSRADAAAYLVVSLVGGLLLAWAGMTLPHL